MYVKYPGAAVARPNKQLRGFKRVAIAAGATSTVTMTLPYRDVAYWDSTSSTWMVENGSVQILVGGPQINENHNDMLGKRGHDASQIGKIPRRSGFLAYLSDGHCAAWVVHRNHPIV